MNIRVNLLDAFRIGFCKSANPLLSTPFYDDHRMEYYKGVARFRQVIEAYLHGIESLLAAGQSVSNLNNVTSYFVGQINALEDPLLEKCVLQGGRTAELANEMLSNLADRSAKQAFRIYAETFSIACKLNEYRMLQYYAAFEKELSSPYWMTGVAMEHDDLEQDLQSDLHQSLICIHRLQEVGAILQVNHFDWSDRKCDHFARPFHELMKVLAIQRIR